MPSVCTVCGADTINRGGEEPGSPARGWSASQSVARMHQCYWWGVHRCRNTDIAHSEHSHTPHTHRPAVVKLRAEIRLKFLTKITTVYCWRVRLFFAEILTHGLVSFIVILLASNLGILLAGLNTYCLLSLTQQSSATVFWRSLPTTKQKNSMLWRELKPQ